MSSLESDSRYKLMESGITHNGYVAPPWIENEGRYFNEEGIFNPDAYDPSAPYKIQGKSFRLASNPDKEFEDPFDLDNLRFLEKHKIENLLKKLEGLAAEIADQGVPWMSDFLSQAPNTPLRSTAQNKSLITKPILPLP
ncbi:MAG: hypothetical protein UW70_C0024G0003 [Candidatus Peregrinibacteria bacterium GW2011_GWA2_44_7]|nr:MAG: hypothetical protein UW70_C0024G0003 [Candidatus Peregrinibacteria bacterium GW2011_GWA2_44_7]